MKTIYSIGGLFGKKCEDISLVGKKLVKLNEWIKEEKNDSWKLKNITSPSFSLAHNVSVYGGDYFEYSSRETGKAIHGSTKDLSFLEFNKPAEYSCKKIKELSFEGFSNFLSTNPLIYPDYVFVNKEINYDRFCRDGTFRAHYGLVSYENILKISLFNKKKPEEKIYCFIKPKGFPRREFYLPANMGIPWIVREGDRGMGDLKIKAKIMAKNLSKEKIHNLRNKLVLKEVKNQ